MTEFRAAAFDGCIGSADVTHIIMEKCYARLKNQNTGPKDSHTTGAYQLVVNHRRQILASTVGFHDRWNDATIVRFDDFITDILRMIMWRIIKLKELNACILYLIISFGIF